MLVTPISPEAVLPLRQAILRPGHPLQDAVFPHDTDPETVHLGAFVDEELVGVASIYHESQPGWDNLFERRLRGMAVAEEMQRKGIGSALLQVSACQQVAHHSVLARPTAAPPSTSHAELQR